uniref:Beta-lactamase domain-containing protein n=1 Tax=Macrostomum lignano TaxID=282301 RepID=A0A1I8IWF8_9PLAT
VALPVIISCGISFIGICVRLQCRSRRGDDLLTPEDAKQQADWQTAEQQRSVWNLAFVLLCCLQLVAAGASYYPLDTAAVRRVLERTMRCQSVPQLHAAVVHANQEIFSVKLEKLASGEIKDIADTDVRLLYLASVSKGMFGTALVQVEKHLREQLKNQSFSLFSTPIKQLIGDQSFWFADHGLSEIVTIDDMLSHRTGLSRHDSMWYLNEWQSKEDLAKHVGRLKTASEFRGSFVYNNLVWTIADMAVQRLTNRSFVQYMREFLWQPLGMTDTHGSSEIKQKQLLDRVVINQQYKRLEVPLEMSKMERFVEAAGGILASLPDMSRYMRHLASPKHSVYEPAPGQFRPLNALAAGVGNALFNPQLYNASVVSDLPDWEIESYGRGWKRTWYG